MVRLALCLMTGLPTAELFQFSCAADHRAAPGQRESTLTDVSRTRSSLFPNTLSGPAEETW